MKNSVLIINSDGTRGHLLPKLIRSLGVYCEVHPGSITAEKIKSLSPNAIIFTSGDISADFKIGFDIAKTEVPVLAIGSSYFFMLKQLGAEVCPVKAESSALINAAAVSASPLLDGVAAGFSVYTDTNKYVEKLPEGFFPVLGDENGESLAAVNPDKNMYALKFSAEHPDTQYGREIIANFLFKICGIDSNWRMKTYMQSLISEVKATVGDGKVLLALSGGVDSSVVAALLSKAVGSQLYCIFVDHGLMRKNEGSEVEAAFKGWDINFIRVDAEKRFLDRLAGVTDPEKKRHIIGEEFIRVFEEEAKKIGRVDFFAQGTIYPDIIESGMGSDGVIKSHHNVGGLPEHVDFKEIIEPVKLLFKDEVRALGKELGLPGYLVNRQPFPGPGLGVRVVGDITKEKLDILREADYIYRAELEKSGAADDISQYFAALSSMRSVGIKNGKRSYDYGVILRAVKTNDFMNAAWARIPYEVLDKISEKILLEVDGVNRIFYDITDKPPGTIELE